MRKIEALIEPEWFGAVMDAVAEARLGSFQASPVSRFDPARHPNQSYRGARYSVGQPRLKLELLVDDDEVDRAIAAIRRGVDSRSERDVELAVLDVHYAFQPGAARAGRGRVRSIAR